MEIINCNVSEAYKMNYFIFQVCVGNYMTSMGRERSAWIHQGCHCAALVWITCVQKASPLLHPYFPPSPHRKCLFSQYSMATRALNLLHFLYIRYLKMTKNIKNENFLKFYKKTQNVPLFPYDPPHLPEASRGRSDAPRAPRGSNFGNVAPEPIPRATP